MHTSIILVQYTPAFVTLKITFVGSTMATTMMTMAGGDEGGGEDDDGGTTSAFD